MPVKTPMYPETNYPDLRVRWRFEELPEEFREKIIKGEKITGREVRKYLKRLFPKGKFKIKTNYSLKVTIFGGAGKEEVEKALAEFNTKTSDAMIDYIGVISHSVLMPDGSVKDIRFGWSLVCVEVDWETRQKLIEKALEEFHKKYPGNTKEEIREMFYSKAIELAENVLIKEL
ncbi:MAG: hypothetical protein DSY42_05980 [Aquifex sp.]|nr:MAG: hypothetical protein DSY42_05980 [Aquifex sp.]